MACFLCEVVLSDSLVFSCDVQRVIHQGDVFQAKGAVLQGLKAAHALENRTKQPVLPARKLCPLQA